MDEAGRVGLPLGKIPARELAPLLKAAGREWLQDRSPRLAAALSYYTLFAITPLLLISIAIAGMIFGEEAARGEVLATVRGVVGDTAGRAVEQIIRSATRSTRQGAIATTVGFVLLLFGASGAFNHLKESLNAIWEIPTASGGGMLRFVRKRLFSFAMVLGVGFLLLVSLIISAALSAATRHLAGFLQGRKVLWEFANVSISLVVITFLFALIFRNIPDIRIAWRDVWMGAAFTSILFTLGKTLIGVYLGRSAVTSAYGAAGSVVVVLIWIYYSSLIVFFGAEFTEVYARRRRDGMTAPRQRLVRHQPLVPEAAARPVLPAPKAVRRGGPVAPVLTGCAGLLVGLILGVLSALIGVLVTAVRAAAKKLMK